MPTAPRSLVSPGAFQVNSVHSSTFIPPTAPTPRWIPVPPSASQRISVHHSAPQHPSTPATAALQCLPMPPYSSHCVTVQDSALQRQLLPTLQCLPAHPRGPSASHCTSASSNAASQCFPVPLCASQPPPTAATPTLQCNPVPPRVPAAWCWLPPRPRYLQDTVSSTRVAGTGPGPVPGSEAPKPAMPRAPSLPQHWHRHRDRNRLCPGTAFGTARGYRHWLWSRNEGLSQGLLRDRPPGDRDRPWYRPRLPAQGPAAHRDLFQVRLRGDRERLGTAPGIAPRSLVPPPGSPPGPPPLPRTATDIQYCLQDRPEIFGITPSFLGSTLALPPGLLPHPGNTRARGTAPAPPWNRPQISGMAPTSPREPPPQTGSPLEARYCPRGRPQIPGIAPGSTFNP